MSNEYYKNIEETLKNILKNKVDNDAKEGNDLLKKCDCNEAQNFCFNEHKNEVIKYIARVDKEYACFLNLYVISLGKTLNGTQVPVNCKTLKLYVDVINKVKEVKDLDENANYLIKLMSGVNNNE